MENRVIELEDLVKMLRQSLREQEMRQGMGQVIVTLDQELKEKEEENNRLKIALEQQMDLADKRLQVVLSLDKENKRLRKMLSLLGE
jgi:hypothetical protein